MIGRHLGHKLSYLARSILACCTLGAGWILAVAALDQTVAGGFAFALTDATLKLGPLVLVTGPACGMLVALSRPPGPRPIDLTTTPAALITGLRVSLPVYLMWGAYHLSDQLFAAVGVKAIAMGAVAALLFIASQPIGVVLRKVAGQGRDEGGGRVEGQDQANSLTAPLVFVAILVAMVWSFRTLESEVWFALDLDPYWPVAAIAVCAIGWSTLVGTPEKPPRVLPGLALLGLLLTTAAVAAAAFYSRQDAPVVTYVAGAGTCKPGHSMQDPSSIGTAAKDAPDIIFLTIDALRWDHTALSGYERPTTPGLAERARLGAVFDGAYTPSCSTRQTFRSLFTGLFPSQTNAPPPVDRGWGLSMAKDQVTLAGFLSAAGYQTTAIVALASIFQERDHGLQGFVHTDRTAIHTPGDPKYSAPFLVDRVIAHLSTYKPKRPRFVWAHVPDAHQPYRSGPTPAHFGSRPIDKYDASIRFVDAEIDRLIAFALGPARRERTFVIITADHGQAFGEHGNKLHGHTTYQEETHVPLLVFGPGIRPSRTATPVSLIDLTPTILAMAGLAPPESLCGTSLLGYLLGDAPLEGRPVYTQITPDYKVRESSESLVLGRYKLMVSAPRNRTELYDIVDDVLEKADLSETHPAELDRMRRALAAYKEGHGI